MPDLDANPDTTDLLAPDQLDATVADCLKIASGFAKIVHFPSVHPGHIALALLCEDHVGLGHLMMERFEGLRTVTVVESLYEILELEAEMKGYTASGLPDYQMPQASDLAAETVGLMQRAKELAAEWAAQTISCQAMICSMFESPDAFIVNAFQDAGIGRAELEELSAHLKPLGLGMAQSETPLEVFVADKLNMEAFGTVTQQALHVLAQLAQAQPERNLRDSDMLYGLLQHENSRLAQALHVMNSPVTNILRYLEGMAGQGQAGADPATLSCTRMSRLLQRLLREAAQLAQAERCRLIAESHVVRTHLARVAGSTNNLYDRFGINSARLQQYLEGYREDRDAVASSPEPTQIEDIEGYLHARVINQEAAIARILPALRRMRANMSEPGRLLGVFLFLGATGVGKTELARAIADIAFGQESGGKDPYLIRIDSGNFQDRRDIVQLLGAPQGLVGYKEGQLTNGLREKPRAVILFDEAEKAYKHIWQSLLPLFDEGLVREADGTEYDATGCIIVATSNLGYKDAMNRFDLWEASADRRKEMQQELEAFVWARVEGHFSPEFRGRFGRENVLFFNHFDEASYRAIVSQQVSQFCREMTNRGFTVTVPDEVIAFLAGLAWTQREYGARPVRRLVTEHLRDTVVNYILEEPDRTRFTFGVRQGSGQVVLEDADGNL